METIQDSREGKGKYSKGKAKQGNGTCKGKGEPRGNVHTVEYHEDYNDNWDNSTWFPETGTEWYSHNEWDYGYPK